MTVARQCACGEPLRALPHYHRGAARYHYCHPRQALAHDHARDLHLAVICREHPERRRVEERITTRYPVLARYQVEWTPSRVRRNLERLGADGEYTNSPTDDRSRVGLNVLVLEDPVASYGYVTDTPHRTRLRNLSVSRLWEEVGTVGGARGPILHATSTLVGFCRSLTLLLGPDEFSRMTEGSGAHGHSGTFREDLVGAEGWADLREVFAVLRRTSRYVLLRSEDRLFDVSPEERGDVDLLCADPSELAAAVDASKIASRFDAGHMCRLSTGEQRLDLHTIGDGYYDPRFQVEVLDHGSPDGQGVILPRPDHHFFTLLYHVKVHKSSVAEHHLRTLCELAGRIGLEDVGPADVIEDEAAARLLAGYLASHRYAVATPRDRAVYAGVNRSFVAKLPSSDLPAHSLTFTRWQRMVRVILRSRPARWLRGRTERSALVERLSRLLIRLRL